MLLDSGVFEGPSTIVADNVQELPDDPESNALVYLLQQDGDFVPGLYIFLEQEWKYLTSGDPV